QLQSIADREPYLDYSYPLDQFEGANVSLVWALTQNRSVTTRRDAENYVAALARVPARMNEAVADANTLSARGIVPPRFILDATIAQLDKFIQGGAENNMFVTVLEQRMQPLTDLTDQKRAGLRAQAIDIVKHGIEPAWRNAIEALRAQQPQATDDAGLWRLPG